MNVEAKGPWAQPTKRATRGQQANYIQCLQLLMLYCVLEQGSVILRMVATSKPGLAAQADCFSQMIAQTYLVYKRHETPYSEADPAARYLLSHRTAWPMPHLYVSSNIICIGRLIMFVWLVDPPCKQLNWYSAFCKSYYSGC